MLYLDSTPPPAKVTHMTDKEQKEWVKEVQGLSEQYAALFYSCYWHLSNRELECYYLADM